MTKQNVDLGNGHNGVEYWVDSDKPDTLRAQDANITQEDIDNGDTSQIEFNIEKLSSGYGQFELMCELHDVDTTITQYAHLQAFKALVEDGFLTLHQVEVIEQVSGTLYHVLRDRFAQEVKEIKQNTITVPEFGDEALDD